MIQALQLESESKLEWLRQRRHEIDLQEYERSAVAADFAETNEYGLQGFATAIDCLRVTCHMTGPAVADRIAVGDHIGDMPDTTDCLYAGEIGFGHVVVMSRTAAALAESNTSRPFHEVDLLGKARDNTVGKLHHICRHARHAADPKGVARDEAQLIAERRLKLSTFPDGRPGHERDPRSRRRRGIAQRARAAGAATGGRAGKRR